MKRIFWLFVLLAVVASAAVNAARQAESCSGNCSGWVDGTGAVTGDECWYVVHEDHEQNDRCSNYFTADGGYLTNGEGGEGTCDRTYINGATVHLSCAGSDCSVTSTLKCPGGSFNVSIACHGGNGKTPRASGNSVSAGCYGDGGTFQEVSCNSSGGVTYGQGTY
jgi:hypothetical protein